MSNELAWAAGFYDGEGCTSVHTGGYLRVSITQTDREVLDRFHEAVGGVGKVYGPYDRKKYKTAMPQNWKPHFLYAAYREEAEEVLVHLWPMLSTVKKVQAELVKGRCKQRPSAPGGPTGGSDRC